MLHEHINENQISSQTKHKTYEIETKSKLRRAQGGKGLLSHSISVQSLKNTYSKTYLSRREGRDRDEERRAPGRKRRRLLLVPRHREERRGVRGYLRCTRRGPKYP